MTDATKAMKLPKDKTQFNQPNYVGDENPPGSIPSPTPSPTPPPAPTEPDADDPADQPIADTRRQRQPRARPRPCRLGRAPRPTQCVRQGAAGPAYGRIYRYGGC